MRKAIILTETVALTLLFTLLFYHHPAGLNLVLFELVLVPLAIWRSPGKNPGVPGRLVLASVAVTALFVFFHASAFVITMNIISLLLLTGWLILPGGRSLVSLAFLSLSNLIKAPSRAMNELLQSPGNAGKTALRLKKAAYFILPLFIIFLFIAFYSASNPHFDDLVTQVLKYPFRWVDWFFRTADIPLLVTIVAGMFVSVLFLFPEGYPFITAWDRLAPGMLTRERRRAKGFRRMTVLKDRYRAGVFLLAALNLLILVQNVLDIWHVWIFFKWDGQYLKQFVHEGTWLLILSILVSIAIVLWLYRGNLNFMPGSRLLRRLSYAWLAQNILLAVSVAVRNGWYIRYYSLAYLRIGVFIFLALVFVGLVTVMIKVNGKKSWFYLLRVNSLAALIILTLASCVNWDTLIAGYNFAHYRQSFVHLDWLCTLSDKALPCLDRSEKELAGIRQVQDQNFPRRDQYMKPDEYSKVIDFRKKEFKRKWESRGWLSFNLAEYKAYLYLTRSHEAVQGEKNQGGR